MIIDRKHPSHAFAGTMIGMGKLVSYHQSGTCLMEKRT